MIKVKRALVSVFDKKDIVDLCRLLSEFGVQIISTGGTAKVLVKNNIPVVDISAYTGSPEILDGRVKTLHPKIHGGLLALRDNEHHVQTVKNKGIGFIDMVIVNLYPFEDTVSRPKVTKKEAVEQIDIGGPSMLRSAAKNHESVVVVSSPAQYARLYQELKMNKGCVDKETSRVFACEAFKLTSRYDNAIYSYLKEGLNCDVSREEDFPAFLNMGFSKIQDLRYGENPHQKAAFYKENGTKTGLIRMKQLQGKELSYNNILDLNSVWELLMEFKNPAAVIVKHNNPCGAAQAQRLITAFKDAYACDPLSAFGGIVGFNRALDSVTAGVVAASGFLECIIAPGFCKKTLAMFARKKNLRLLELKAQGVSARKDYKKISGGLLLQEKDDGNPELKNIKVVTSKKPSASQMESLFFAWRVAKHVKSNAIVLTRGTKTVGIGAGQMSRVDAMIIARRKAGKSANGSCLASDAFFPKTDAIIEASRAGVKAIIQPGGSISDEEIIRACNKHKIAMVFTGIRHFRH